MLFFLPSQSSIAARSASRRGPNPLPLFSRLFPSATLASSAPGGAAGRPLASAAVPDTVCWCVRTYSGEGKAVCRAALPSSWQGAAGLMNEVRAEGLERQFAGSKGRERREEGWESRGPREGYITLFASGAGSAGGVPRRGPSQGSLVECLVELRQRQRHAAVLPPAAGTGAGKARGGRVGGRGAVERRGRHPLHACVPPPPAA